MDEIATGQNTHDVTGVLPYCHQKFVFRRKIQDATSRDAPVHLDLGAHHHERHRRSAPGVAAAAGVDGSAIMLVSRLHLQDLARCRLFDRCHRRPCCVRLSNSLSFDQIVWLENIRWPPKSLPYSPSFPPTHPSTQSVRSKSGTKQ